MHGFPGLGDSQCPSGSGSNGSSSGRRDRIEVGSIGPFTATRPPPTVRRTGGTAIEPIRFVLSDLAPLAADLVTAAVERQGDMLVVGVATSLGRLLELVRRTAPDVIVVGLADHRLPAECLALLLERPEMKVIGLRPRDGQAYLFTVRLEQVDIGAVGPGALVDAVREAVHGRR